MSSQHKRSGAMRPEGAARDCREGPRAKWSAQGLNGVAAGGGAGRRGGGTRATLPGSVGRLQVKAPVLFSGPKRSSSLLCKA